MKHRISHLIRSVNASASQQTPKIMRSRYRTTTCRAETATAIIMRMLNALVILE